MKYIAALTLGLASACSAVTAQAAVVIDQQSLSTYYPDKFSGWADVINLPGSVLGTDQSVSTLSAVQTVTAGKEGVLDSVLFAVISAFPSAEILKLSIIDGDYISGSRSLVGTIDVPYSSLPASTPAHPAYSFDVSAFQYHVSPGQKFSILLEPETNIVFSGDALFSWGFLDIAFNPDGTVQVLNAYSTGYQGGKLNILLDGNAFPNQFDYDLIFSSFVDIPGSVPEPATWATMIIGFGGVGFSLRSRRRWASAARQNRSRLRPC